MKTLILLILLTGTANADVLLGAVAGGARAYNDTIRDQQRYEEQKLQYEMLRQQYELQRQQQQTYDYTERYREEQYNVYPYTLRR